MYRITNIRWGNYLYVYYCMSVTNSCKLIDIKKTVTVNY